MICKYYTISKVILNSSMVEHSAVNRGVVGSSPTWGAIKQSDGLFYLCHNESLHFQYRYGPLVKRLRHRPFTAVTGVRFPYGSFLVAMRPRETPVPIPNTMVKPWTADGTWLVTTRESRWLPILYIHF